MLNRALQGATAAAAEKLYVENVMSVYLYTGTGSTQTITNGIDLSGKGGLVWLKTRSTTYSHFLYDTARGATYALKSDATEAQSTWTTGLSGFSSTGFDLGSNFQHNSSSQTYASWTFRKQPKFFDVVTWTGNGTSSRNIAHTLGSTPGFIIVKRTSATADWWCWHRSISTGNLSGNDLILLNSTAAKTNIGTVIGTASSSTFEVGGDSSVNASGSTYVAYLFAHNAGGFGTAGTDNVVSCGTFTAGASGFSEVSLGWEPQWILVKTTNATQNWYLWDTMRGMAVTSSVSLSPNLSGAELDWGATSYIYPTANGFAGSGDFFGNGSTVIYIAIRRGPMKTPTDATKVFAPLARTGNGSSTYVLQSGFSTDSAVHINRNAGYGWYSADRLRGLTTLSYNTTGAESSAYPIAGWDAANNNGVIVGNTNNAWNENGGSLLYYSFRRAPGFCDVVAYAGTGAVQQINHSLGVKPELLFVKVRSTSGRNWIAAIQGNGGYLNTNDAFSSGITFINLTTQSTTTTFRVDASAEIGGTSNTYIAYLFASCPGVSKVGSYTGTGTTLSIDCGFTNGSRLVMIKRTDSTGDWYVWDTARGIVSGNDSYLLLNSTAAEVTNTDYIDPLSSGFQISSTAPAAINANGGTFIYLSVA